jgi:hypothetical protein
VKWFFALVSVNEVEMGMRKTTSEKEAKQAGGEPAWQLEDVQEPDTPQYVHTHTQTQNAP